MRVPTKINHEIRALGGMSWHSRQFQNLTSGSPLYLLSPQCVVQSPRQWKRAIAQTCSCLPVLQRYSWLTGQRYIKTAKEECGIQKMGHQLSLHSGMEQSSPPNHSGSAFTYTRRELIIHCTVDIPRIPRTLEKIPFFQISFPWLIKHLSVPSGNTFFTCLSHSSLCFRKTFYFLWGLMPSIHHRLYTQAR